MSRKAQTLLIVITTVALAFAATTKLNKVAIQNSTVDSTTIGATTPSSVVVTTFQANTSMLSTGTAFKHTRGTTCTTAASLNASCATTVSWPGSNFADTNYTYGCNVESTGGVVAYLNADPSNKTIAHVSIEIINTPGNNSAASGTYNCWAFHD